MSIFYYAILLVFMYTNPIQARHIYAGPAVIIDDYSGVEISSEVVLPRAWVKRPIYGRWDEVDEQEFFRSAEILKKAFSKYDAGLLKKNLNRIYIAGGLKFYGVRYGGTYYENEMYLVNSGESAGYSDDFIEGSFHHEFSSLLLTNNSSQLDRNEWMGINPAGFTYFDEELGGAGAIKTGQNSLDFSDSLNALGFLNMYSTSTMENDFNEFARSMLLEDSEFFSRVERFPALKAKYLLIKDFYNSIK